MQYNSSELLTNSTNSNVSAAKLINNSLVDFIRFFI